MEIVINDNKRLDVVRKEFSRVFPNLKIEFFSSEHGTGEASSLSDLIDGGNTIGEIRTRHDSGIISINGEMKVGEVEEYFQDKFGIPVQVFHRSGERWVQSTTTDYWTLDKLNSHSKKTMSNE